MASERGRGRGIRWLVGILVVLVLAWCGYWYAASRAAEAALARFAAALSKDGGSVACAEQAVRGFPLSLDLLCAGGKLATQPANLGVGLNRVSVQAPLYYPGRVATEFIGPLVLDAPQAGVALSASWQAATAKIDVGLNGLTRAAGRIDGLTLDQTGPRLPFRHVAASHLEFGAAPAEGADYRITGAARDLTVERPDGQAYPLLGGQLDLTAVNFGSGIGIDPKKAIAAWAAAGGKLRVDRLQVSAGSFTAAAAGNLTLDREGLLSGTLTLSLTGLASLPDLAEQLQPGSRKRVTRVVAAVTAVTQPTGNGDVRQIPIVVSKGVITVMFIPLAVIPAVKL